MTTPLTIAVTGLHAGENPQPGPGVIRSLRRRLGRDDVFIVGLVYDVLESATYTDDGPDATFEIPYPSAGNEAVLARLDYIHSRYPIDILIPTLDAEIMPLIQLEEALAERGIKMLLPKADSFKSRSKTALEALAEACSCHTPKSIAVYEPNGAAKAAAELGYPVIIKGQYYEAYKAVNQADLLAHFHAIANKWGTPVLVQEFVDGSEFNVIAVGDGEGGTGGYCTIRKTIISEKGKGYGAVVIRDETLNQIALCIIEHLKWRGPIEVEFLKEDATGEYCIIEVNPRFPAWVDFPSTLGHNLPALVVETLQTGSMPRLPDYPTGKFFLRHCVDITCDVADMGKLSALGEWIRNETANEEVTHV
jgi:carbamoyl-phosphate synthase large subunit